MTHINYSKPSVGWKNTSIRRIYPLCIESITNQGPYRISNGSSNDEFILIVNTTVIFNICTRWILGVNDMIKRYGQVQVISYDQKFASVNPPGF